VRRGRDDPQRHPAIIDAALWETVQAKLVSNRVARVNGERAEVPSLLAGLVYDETGERMSPTHTNKKGHRYRYYVSQALIKGRRGAAPLGRRVPAGELEALVENRLAAFLSAEPEVFAAIELEVTDAAESSGLITRAVELARSWPELAPAERRQMLLALLSRVDIHRDSVEIRLFTRGLLSILQDENGRLDRKHAAEETTRTVRWSIPVRLRRTGIEKRLLIGGTSDAERRVPDHSLCRLLAQAQQYHGMLMRGDGKTITQLAQDARVTGSYFTRVLRLNFLAPEILQAILRNRHPIDLSAKRLVNKTRLPVAWDAQRALLGID
jgi:hypothetical protein